MTTTRALTLFGVDHLAERARDALGTLALTRGVHEAPILAIELNRTIGYKKTPKGLDIIFSVKKRLYRDIPSHSYARFAILMSE